MLACWCTWKTGWIWQAAAAANSTSRSSSSSIRAEEPDASQRQSGRVCGWLWRYDDGGAAGGQISSETKGAANEKCESVAVAVVIVFVVLDWYRSKEWQGRL